MLKTVTRIILAAVALLGAVSLIEPGAQAAEIIPSLELRVNRLSGVTRIITTGTPPALPDINGFVNLASYEIASDAASLPLEDVWIPGGGNWTSITSLEGAPWTEVPVGGSATQLGELNLTSFKPLTFGDEVPLGNIYDTTDTEEDITFTYGVAGSSTPVVGNVVFEGLLVPAVLELRVNRLTGLTRIVGTNGSSDPADQNVAANLASYEIASNAANAPLENVWDFAGNWTSITSTLGAPWTEVPVGGSATQLGELNLTSFKSVSGGDVISLGNIYDTAVTEEDVTFSYGLAGNSIPFTGNVVFEGLIVPAPLELHVNRFTGETRIVGTLGSTDPADQNVAADLASYEIASNAAVASAPLEDVWIPTGGNWTSLTVQDGAPWIEVPVGGSATQLGELNLTGSKTVSNGDVISLGTIYDVTDTEEDITFLYGLDGNSNPIVGSVVFDGLGLHLRVNKSTGKIEIVNAETAGVDFDGYVIQSVSGDLNVATWSSLEDQAVPGWEVTNSTSFDISELNLTSSSPLASAGLFDLGAAYQGGVGGVEDLSFVFNLAGAGPASGVVEYIIAGDMDGDGDVDADDVPLFVQALVARAAYDANGFTNLAGFLVDADIVGDVDGSSTFDLGDLSAFSALLGGPASATAVPEPASGGLLLMALGALALVGYRRKEQ